MYENMSTVDLLRLKKQELVERIEVIDEDLSVLTAMEPEGTGPVHIDNFFEESGEFNWLFGGVIAEGTVSMVVAAPGLGKTTLIAQMSLALSAGQDVLGFRVTRPRKVLYLLAEGSRHAFRSRLKTTRNSMGLGTAATDWWLPPASMSDFRLSSRAVDRVIRSSRADLVVLDTLGYFSGGDENDASAWKERVMAPIRTYAQELGSAFILVHHTRKTGPNTTGESWESGRGTSAMFGDVDHYLTLGRVPLTPREEELPREDRDRLEQRRVLSVIKNKYGIDGGEIQLEFWKPRGTFELGCW